MATPEPARAELRSPATPRPWNAAHRTWIGGGLGLLALLIAVRWLRYTEWASLPPFDAVFRELMVIDVQAFVWPWVYTLLKLDILAIAVVVLAAGLHRRLRNRVVVWVDGKWALTGAAASLLVLAMLWLHYLFDVNVTVAKACAMSLLLAGLTARPARDVRLPPVLVGIVLAGWLVAAGDGIDRLALLAWAAVLALAASQAARVHGPTLALLLTAAVMPINLLTALLPLALPLHGGQRLGNGLAYGFCEVPGRGTVFATIPVCDSVKAGFERCRDGRVVEYDRTTNARVASYNYLSRDFHGRLELIECLDDEVQVSVQAAVIHGKGVITSVLAFPAADPTVFNPIAAGAGVGITIAYDRPHDALFYSAEFSHRVVRMDRGSQRLDEVPAADLARRWIQPVSLSAHTGSAILYTTSIHPGRNRIYIGEWMQGRYAHAVDLTSMRVVHRYEVGGGGALGITVDVERDRLLVSSVWGFEVFDLATDALIARRRVGFGNRPMIVDAARNRLYLGSTVEGKIRILERDTFAVLGQIPIGTGTRFARLSADGTTLYASSVGAHYAFDVDGL